MCTPTLRTRIPGAICVDAATFTVVTEAVTEALQSCNAELEIRLESAYEKLPEAYGSSFETAHTRISHLVSGICITMLQAVKLCDFGYYHRKYT